MLRIDARELWFVIVERRFVGLVGVVGSIMWVFAFIELVDVVKGVVFVTPVVWVVKAVIVRGIVIFFVIVIFNHGGVKW